MLKSEWYNKMFRVWFWLFWLW